METVSIIMPCYNEGQYIEESVASVLKQTYPAIELIIVDDGSTDSYTKQLLQAHTWANTKVIYTINQGPSVARNKGIKEATGTYILPLDADDIIEPTYIEKAVQAISEDTTRGIVYCKAELFGVQKGAWDLPPYTLQQMLKDNVIFVSALFRKSDWEKVGGFDETMSGGMEDYEFWLALIEKGAKVYQLPEVLFYYRKKGDSRSVTFQKDEVEVMATYLYIYNKHLALYTSYDADYTQDVRIKWVKGLCFRQKVQQKLGYLNYILEIPGVKKTIKRLWK